MAQVCIKIPNVLFVLNVIPTRYWQSSIIEAQKVCQNAQNMTVIADREGDIYQALICFREQLKVDFFNSNEL